MGKKYKVLQVDECFQCCRHFMAPLNQKTGLREYVCELKDFKTVPDPYKIPKWCPLSDAVTTIKHKNIGESFDSFLEKEGLAPNLE